MNVSALTKTRNLIAVYRLTIQQEKPHFVSCQQLQELFQTHSLSLKFQMGDRLRLMDGCFEIQSDYTLKEVIPTTEEISGDAGMREVWILINSSSLYPINP